MPRLSQVPRAEVTDRTVLQYYDFLFGPDRDPVTVPGTATGTSGNWWTVFALVPDIFEHAVRGFGLYRDPVRKLNPILRELAQTRAGWVVGSQFVYSQHCKALRDLGVPEDKISAVRDWQVAGCFDEKEIAVLAYPDCLAMARGRVPDGVFAKVKSFLSDEEILELTYITCLYDMHAVISRALKLEYDEREDPVVEVASPK